jgi:Ca2+-binding RTX toxin-like protein
MTMRQGLSRSSAALIAVTLSALAPSVAHGAEAHVESAADGSRTIVFTGAAGEANDVLVDRDPGFTNDQYQLEDQDNAVSPGPGCTQKLREPFNSPEPKIVRCETAGVTSIRIVLADGNDGARFGKLNGNVITDVVDGGDGDDRIDASDGPTVVTAGAGADNVNTRGGDDQVGGGDGDDEIVGGPGSDTIAGDGGNDIVRGYAVPGTLDIGVVTKFRGGEINRLSGGDGNDVLEGDNGPDEIAGDGGNDRLNGGGSGDVLRGDAGDDTLDEGDTAGAPDGESVGPPIAADVVHGGAGKDTATYCTRRGTAALSISLDRKANDGQKGEGDSIGPAGDVENVIGGGESNDKITGSAAANVLTGDCLTTVGADGDNKIYGLAGNDRLVGGAGRDTLDGGKGGDVFLGNEERDTIKAKDGAKDKSINCDGHGTASKSDSASVDRSDPSAKGCDKVTR